MEQLIRFAADGLLLLILAAAMPLIFLSLSTKWWQNAPIVVMAGLTSLFVGKMMSLLYQPAVARPFLELGVQPGATYIDNPGFPSDHALLATVVTVAVFAVTKHRRIAVFLAALVLVMCVARVLALVHTPLDVIAGVLAGLSGAIWYRRLTE